MVTEQKHSSDSTPSEQEAIRYTEKLAQIFGLDEQNTKVYSTLFGENMALKKQLEDYHSQPNTLERRVKRLEKDVRSLKDELKDLDECVDRETVVDLIQEIAFSPKIKKCKGFPYSSESSEDSDSVEIIKRPQRYHVEEVIPHKQRRNARRRKVKRFVV